MIIQDLIFGLGGILFFVALIPAIFSGSGGSLPLKTSLLTASVLYSFTICYYSLDLDFAAITSLSSAVAWSILALEKIYYIEKGFDGKASKKITK